MNHPVSATMPSRLGRVLGAARPVSETAAMFQLLARLGSDLVTSVTRRRFPLEELLLQTWYTIRVCTLPALMVSIPVPGRPLAW